MAITTKQRRITLSSGRGITRAMFAFNELTRTFQGYNFEVAQRTTSEGHAWPPSRKAKSDKTLDLGGAFTTWKAEYHGDPVMVHIESPPPHSGSWYQYDGPIFAAFSQTQSLMTTYISGSSVSQLNAKGTTAIARTLPTNPLSGMGQFLGELRQLPSIPDIRKWFTKARNFSRLRAAGSNYLNVVFGWLPFVKDVKDFARVASKSPGIIDNYVRNSGRGMRRRFNFPTTDTTVIEYTTPSYGEPVLLTPFYVSPGTLTKTVRTITKQWFSGSFTYYLPGVEGPLNYMKSFESTAHRLYGLRLDLDLLWRLTPWSWAVGWVSNAGDVVRNFSAFQNDGLVMKYGYIMETKTIITTWSLAGLRLSGGRTVSCTQTVTQTVKQRVKATPYGFGLLASGFTPKQWSIIAALGISRAPRSLNF